MAHLLAVRDDEAMAIGWGFGWWVQWRIRLVWFGSTNGTERPHSCAEVNMVGGGRGCGVGIQTSELGRGMLTTGIKKAAFLLYFGVCVAGLGAAARSRLRRRSFLGIKSSIKGLRGYWVTRAGRYDGGLQVPWPFWRAAFCVRISHRGSLCRRGNPRTWRWFRILGKEIEEDGMRYI